MTNHDERRRGPAIRTAEGESLPAPRWLAPAALCLALTAPVTALAAEIEGRWALRATAGTVFTADDVATIAATQSGPVAGEATHELGDGTELGLALGYRPTRRIGVELGYYVADHDTTFTLRSGEPRVLRDDDTVAVETVTAGVAYHLRPERRVDVVLGAFVAMSKADDLVFHREIGRRDKLSFDDDVGPGLRAAVVVPFAASSPWHLVAEARYVSTILESDSGGRDLEYDPITLAIGVGYRW